MSEKTPDPSAGSDPFSELASLAMAATQHNITLTQNWSDTVLTTLKQQSEDARAALTTLTASLQAMERALVSQEETNRALRQSLENYREIVDRYAAASERTNRLVTTAIDELKAGGERQLAAAKALLMPAKWAPGPMEAAEPFTQMIKAWTDTFTRLSGGRTTDPRS